MSDLAQLFGMLHWCSVCVREREKKGERKIVGEGGREKGEGKKREMGGERASERESRRGRERESKRMCSDNPPLLSFSFTQFITSGDLLQYLPPSG